MVLVLMGVSGTGKSTVGKLLADSLGWTFVEGDDYHPPANVAKMTGGTPLTDDDRRPWLGALRTEIDGACRRGENVVLACSALKHAYQDYLEAHEPDCVSYVYLHGSKELLHERLEDRQGHFMKADMLDSQLDTLEPPADAIRVDVSRPPEEIAKTIREKLGF